MTAPCNTEVLPYGLQHSRCHLNLLKLNFYLEVDF